MIAAAVRRAQRGAHGEGTARGFGARAARDGRFPPGLQLEHGLRGGGNAATRRGLGDGFTVALCGAGGFGMLAHRESRPPKRPARCQDA